MNKSGIHLVFFFICAGITIFSALSPIVVGQRMGPGMMYGYGPGYGINTTGSQTGYGPGYLMGPWMMYGYRPAYGMGPEVMYGYYGYGAGNSTSIADEISKLASLKKEGLITQDEYAKLKNRLIG